MAAKKLRGKIGRFELDATQTAQGRPVYKRIGSDHYIFYCSKFNFISYWDIAILFQVEDPGWWGPTLGLTVVGSKVQ